MRASWRALWILRGVPISVLDAVERAWAEEHTGEPTDGFVEGFIEAARVVARESEA